MVLFEKKSHDYTSDPDIAIITKKTTPHYRIRPFHRPPRPHSSPLMGILVKIGVRAFIDASTNPIGGRGLVFSGGELFIFYME